MFFKKHYLDIAWFMLIGLLAGVPLFILFNVITYIRSPADIDNTVQISTDTAWVITGTHQAWSEPSLTIKAPPVVTETSEYGFRRLQEFMERAKLEGIYGPENLRFSYLLSASNVITTTRPISTTDYWAVVEYTGPTFSIISKCVDR